VEPGARINEQGPTGKTFYGNGADHTLAALKGGKKNRFAGNGGCDDGELVLLEGGLRLGYGVRDVVLLIGSRLRGFTPIKPRHKNRDCSRFSMVHLWKGKAPSGMAHPTSTLDTAT